MRNGVNMSTKVLILAGEGINCEQETSLTFSSLGAQTEVLFLEEFLGLESFNDFDILVFPGGFSYGDEIRSGKILANKLRHFQQENLDQFINRDKKPVLGICNGFQILMQLGVFNETKGRHLTLAENTFGEFLNDWAELRINQKTPCIWLENIQETLFMPIRNKEGLLYGEIPEHSIALEYTTPYNGKAHTVAGLTNQFGNVLGLMPHPEAATHPFLFPKNNHKFELNIKLFNNAIEYVQRMKNA